MCIQELSEFAQKSNDNISFPSTHGLSTRDVFNLGGIDPATGDQWDLSLEGARRRAWKYVRKFGPKMIIGTSNLDSYERLKVAHERRSDEEAIIYARKRIVKHMEEMNVLYRHQMATRKFFVHYQSIDDKTWKIRSTREVMFRNEAESINCN